MYKLLILLALSTFSIAETVQKEFEIVIEQDPTKTLGGFTKYYCEAYNIYKDYATLHQCFRGKNTKRTYVIIGVSLRNKSILVYKNKRLRGKYGNI